MLWPGTPPTQRVSRGSGPVRALAAAPGGLPLEPGVDAVVIAHNGSIVASGGVLDEPRALFSISKSVVGCVAAILVSRGLLSLDEPVVAYVPELASSGYAGATVRQVLDMRSGVRFVEDYNDPESDVRRLDRWLADERPLYEFVSSLRAEAPHGTRFLYRSAETDVLGWVCERAGGVGMPELVSSLVWGPMGAADDAVWLTDAGGTAVHDGGLAATALDVLRFGLWLLDSPTWLQRAWAVDAAARNDFLRSPAEASFPGGWYRNQCWFRPGPSGNVLLCLGIHGQVLYVGRRTRTVCVQLSSWPEPQQPASLRSVLSVFDAVAPRPRSSIL